ncbi:fumarate reductase subunit A [Bacillaceae bacterium]
MEFFDTDVLVIGGGCAGLRAAIAARQKGANVTIVTKGKIGQGSATSFLDHLIEFTVVGVSRDQEDEQLFIEDLLSFGHHVNNPELVAQFVKSTRSEFHYLQSLGIPFAEEGLMFPSHRSPRLFRGIGEFGELLLERLKREAESLGVTFIENACVYFIEHNDHSYTCHVLQKGEPVAELAFHCTSLLLATGGGGQIFSLTTNPNGSTGDGIALAMELGAEVTNIEFIHYLPLLVRPIRGYYILSPVVTKGKITNTENEPYVPNLPEGYESLEPSVLQGHILLDLCQWIERQILAGKVTDDNAVYWDGSDLRELILEKMPNSYQLLKDHGLDLFTQKAEISVGCHQMMGGVKIDGDGRTTVPGLFAAGEVAGGIQGAERLMGTGVMDGLVFGARAGKAAAEYALTHKEKRILQQPSVNKSSAKRTFDFTREELSALKNKVKRLMDMILITKDRDRLQERKETLEAILRRLMPYQATDLPSELRIPFSELKNMLIVSLAYILVSLHRKESRGSFRRIDYPRKEEAAYPSVVVYRKHGQDIAFDVRFN